MNWGVVRELQIAVRGNVETPLKENKSRGCTYGNSRVQWGCGQPWRALRVIRQAAL